MLAVPRDALCRALSVALCPSLYRGLCIDQNQTSVHAAVRLPHCCHFCSKNETCAREGQRRLHSGLCLDRGDARWSDWVRVRVRRACVRVGVWRASSGQCACVREGAAVRVQVGAEARAWGRSADSGSWLSTKTRRQKGTQSRDQSRDRPLRPQRKGLAARARAAPLLRA